MRAEDFAGADGYDAFLRETLGGWPPWRRTALAAALAERWLPAYAEFSAAADWGDPGVLRRALDAVWGHALGRPLAPAERARLAALVDDVTPHMDDFDAPEALAACAMVAEALECCAGRDGVHHAAQAVVSGFHAVVPDWDFDPDDAPRHWQLPEVRAELTRQLQLIERVGAVPRLDAAVEALRAGPAGAGPAGRAAERPPAPAGLTNQAAFEQYRRLLEGQLKQPRWVPPAATPHLLAMMIFAQWGTRYLLRRRTITGGHGPLADTAACQALVARERAREAAESHPPDWDPEVGQVFTLCLANPLAEYDVQSPEQPHGFGPSLRRLWAAAKRAGLSDADAWESVVAWARHRPAAWEAEDRRRKKQLPHTAPGLEHHLAREVAWAATGDPDCPWGAEVDGAPWRVRLNDFPDDLMYTLRIGDADAGAFHDWPASWRRG